MIQITLKGLAKFMTATPANQRKILHDYKYPKEEGQAMAQYYKEARDIIYSFHKNKHPKQWLGGKAEELRKLAAGISGGSSRRLSNNARAIEQYGANFPDRNAEVLQNFDVSMTNQNLRIKITPDLHICEGGKEKIVKLEFSKIEPTSELTKIICQAMYEAAARSGRSFAPACVLYLDVPRGLEHRGARQGSRMKGEIEAACKNIVSMWPSI
jgi:hypothetical protein